MMRRCSLILLAAVVLAATLLVTGVSQAAAPWADRGWIEGPLVQGTPTLENPKQGLRVLWPISWAVDREEQYKSHPTVLISIKKFDARRSMRAGLVIVSVPVGKETIEEFFSREVAYLRRQPALQVLGTGPAAVPGMYEMQWVLTRAKLRARNLFFIRNGHGYSVTLVQAADATSAELAELDKVRRYMALPEARSVAAQLQPAGLRVGSIVFARSMTADLQPINPGVQFPAGINEIHAIFPMEGLKAGDVMGDVLYAGTDKVLDERKTAVQILGRVPAAHNTIAYNYSYGSGGFPPGPYRLELSVNGKVVQTGTFEVVAK